MKDEYIRYIIELFVLDGNFDTMFGSDWVDSSQLDSILMSTCDSAFAAFGVNASGRYTDQAMEVLKVLLESNAIVQDGDEYSGFWFKLRPPVKYKVLSPKHEERPVSQRIKRLGEPALERAILRIAQEDGLEAINGFTPGGEYLDFIERSKIEDIRVPASDRIILRSDNQDLADQAVSLLDEIAANLESNSNEVGDKFGDDREVALSEVNFLRKMASQSRIRVTLLINYAKQSLTWIAEKAASTAVGDLASRALSAFFEWLSK